MNCDVKKENKLAGDNPEYCFVHDREDDEQTERYPA